MPIKVFPPSVPVQAVNVVLRFEPFNDEVQVIEGMVELPDIGKGQEDSVTAFYLATVTEDRSLADVPWSFTAKNVDLPTYSNTAGARTRPTPPR